MEPPAAEDEPGRAEPPRAEWRSLGALRDRVDAAAREIERLRSENAALAKRLIDLQDHAAAPSFSLAGAGEGDDPEALRARVQGFIDLVDGLLAAPEPRPEEAPPEANGQPQATGQPDPADNSADAA